MNTVVSNVFKFYKNYKNNADHLKISIKTGPELIKIRNYINGNIKPSQLMLKN